MLNFVCIRTHYVLSTLLTYFVLPLCTYVRIGYRMLQRCSTTHFMLVATYKQIVVLTRPEYSTSSEHIAKCPCLMAAGVSSQVCGSRSAHECINNSTEGRRALTVRDLLVFRHPRTAPNLNVVFAARAGRRYAAGPLARAWAPGCAWPVLRPGRIPAPDVARARARSGMNDVQLYSILR